MIERSVEEEDLRVSERVGTRSRSERAKVQDGRVEAVPVLRWRRDPRANHRVKQHEVIRLIVVWVVLKVRTSVEDEATPLRVTSPKATEATEAGEIHLFRQLLGILGISECPSGPDL